MEIDYSTHQHRVVRNIKEHSIIRHHKAKKYHSLQVSRISRPRRYVSDEISPSSTIRPVIDYKFHPSQGALGMLGVLFSVSLSSVYDLRGAWIVLEEDAKELGRLSIVGMRHVTSLAFGEST
jgi:hypothetical protein